MHCAAVDIDNALQFFWVYTLRVELLNNMMIKNFLKVCYKDKCTWWSITGLRCSLPLGGLPGHCCVTGGAVQWEVHTSHLVDIGLGHVICFGQWAVRGQNACLISGDIGLAFAIFLLTDE